MNPRLVDFGYGAAWRTVRALPEPLARGLFRAIADGTYRRDAAPVRQLRANLARVVGPQASPAELDALTREAMRSYCRYWMEVFRLPSYSRDDILRRFTLDNHEVFDKHRGEGSGVIVAIPHSGNWDLAGAWVCARGWPLTTVAERLRAGGVYQRFLDFRRGLGMEILPHTGGEEKTHAVLSRRLREGHIVPLVADRDLSRQGVEVDFFGEKTRMPVGPGWLAVRTKAPLYTVVLRYDSATHCYGKLEGPIRVPQTGPMADRVAHVTQEMADAFAAGIAQAPVDWHMLQRLWLTDVDANR